MEIPIATRCGPRGAGLPAVFGLLLALLAALAVSQSRPLVFSERLFAWMERQYGVEARRRVEHLRDLIERHVGADEQTQIRAVNRFFNRVRYDEDAALWDRKDYWATPFEVLGIDAADCEDYALSKYFALVSMGMPEEKLRVTYVKAVELRQAHMVLAYYPSPGAEPLILDNLIDRIEPASRRTDLVPVYSFNGADLWLAVNRVKGRRVGGSDRIKRWRAFRERLERQMEGGS